MSSDAVVVRIGTPRMKRGVAIVQRKFLVTGTVTGFRLKKVIVTLFDGDDTDVTHRVVTRVINVHPAPERGQTGGGKEGSLYRWAVVVDTIPQHIDAASHLPAGNYQLVVSAEVRTGTTSPTSDGITITLPDPVAPLGFGDPTIDHPPPGTPYTLTTEELDFFYTTGGSDVPISDVTLGGVSANYFYWVQELEYWVAEFLYVGDNYEEGAYKIIVTNEDGSKQQRVIVDL